jgi:DNA (cytosine-5)-methyltransferase 1
MPTATLRYSSVCDGIGAAHVAWQPLGWQCQWTSEIKPFPVAVVEHHYGFCNLGNMTKITEDMIHEPVDLLVGGTPCQSFSVAGLRGGLADPRGNLALRFVQLAAVMQPRWVVWENVPGVLSSGKGRDFGTFLGALGELGYGFAYRILDAQWFGVAQRRRRVFVVGYLGDWRRAAAVLFERESVFGNPPTRGAAWEGVARSTAASLTSSGRGVERPGESRGQDDVVIWKAGDPCHSSATQRDAETGMLVAFGGNRSSGPLDVATSCLANGSPQGRQDFASETFVACFHPTQDPISSEDGLTHALGTGSSGGCATAAVAFKPSHYTRGKDGAPSEVAAPLLADAGKGDQGTVVAVDLQNVTVGGDLAGTLDTTRPSRGGGQAVAYDGYNQKANEDISPSVRIGRDSGDCLVLPMAVRRLTPRECERLQGFPDDYTLVTYRGKPACDGPRYRALGNSMAVPVMRWIGERISILETVR